MATRARELRAGPRPRRRDLTSYAPVLEAERLPADDPERAGRLEAALGDASRAPLAIAEAAAETAELAAGVTPPATRQCAATR